MIRQTKGKNMKKAALSAFNKANIPFTQCFTLNPSLIIFHLKGARFNVIIEPLPDNLKPLHQKVI